MYCHDRNRPVYRCSVVLVLSLMLVGGFAVRAADTGPLTLAEAERLAQQQDPITARFGDLAAALDEEAVAAGQLPDPKLKLGLAGLPTDSFSRTQESMTQLQLGVQQAFPRGDSLELRARKTLALAASQRAGGADRQRRVLRAVRERWLELYYWTRAAEVVRKSRRLFAQMVGVTRDQYAAGRHNQQDVIRAQLELARLDDRLTGIRARVDGARADLAKWTGQGTVARSLPGGLPQLARLAERAEIEASLPQHPLIRAQQDRVLAGQEGVALARQAYKPGVTLDVTYGQRSGRNMDGSKRADLLSAMVVLDLPLFREKRQDRRLRASQHKLSAAQRTRDEIYRDLRRMLGAGYADWVRLGERLELYQKDLLPQARQNAEASLNAYQNDRADFATLMRARIGELDTRLQAIRLRVDRAKAQARLLYLAGEGK